jgi:hypothetical protein
MYGGVGVDEAAQFGDYFAVFHGNRADLYDTPSVGSGESGGFDIYDNVPGGCRGISQSCLRSAQRFLT